MNTRAGRFVPQIEGYSAYVPAKLPPSDPPIEFDVEMISLLSVADLALGRLDGVTQTLPNPDLFVSMYVKKEALLSSQIEGTQASLSELLETEEKQTSDAREVTNYVNALNYGLKRLMDDDFPLSLRLLREIHEKLLASGRGSARNPGQFRVSQNWIGGAGCTLSNAAFVPPAVDDMHDALGDLEQYFYVDDKLPPLVKIALIHAQFETIHPFLDGNGRMGRLLITFWLCQQGILSRPLLYLSYFFKRNRSEYYERLMAIRFEGQWEEWVKFFLRGVAEISSESFASAQEIDRLRVVCEQKIDVLDAAVAVNARKLLDRLFVTPQVTRKGVADSLGVSAPTAGALVRRFCDDLGILVDMTPKQSRGKRYAFKRYLDILEVGTD